MEQYKTDINKHVERSNSPARRMEKATRTKRGRRVEQTNPRCSSDSPATAHSLLSLYARVAISISKKETNRRVFLGYSSNQEQSGRINPAQSGPKWAGRIKFGLFGDLEDSAYVIYVI